MQKHEREAVSAIKALLEPAGWSIRTENGSRAKMVVWAEREGRRERKTLCSSPRDAMQDLHHARQWASRLLRSS